MNPHGCAILQSMQFFLIHAFKYFASLFLLQNLYMSDFFCTFAAKLELKEEYERIRF